MKSCLIFAKSYNPLASCFAVTPLLALLTTSIIMCKLIEIV